jgi:transcriptional regulator with XRE-family HTH domain
MSKKKSQRPGKKISSADAIANQMCRRVHELRKKRRWTLEEMSAACGVSRSMLSDIERGRANPTLAVAFRISEAFGMPLGDLIHAPAGAQQVEVIRADDRSHHYRSDGDCRIRTLSPLRLEKAVEYYEIVLRPGGALRSAAHFDGARELLTVQQGSAQITSGKNAEDLGRGDSAYYRADVPHAIENTGKEEAVLFLVVTYTQD